MQWGAQPRFHSTWTDTEWMLICLIYPHLTQKWAKGRQDCERGAVTNRVRAMKTGTRNWNMKVRQVRSHLPSTGSVFQYRWGWALPHPPRCWFSLLGGGIWTLERCPLAVGSQAVPWEEMLQQLWLKIFTMPKSGQIGKRRLKGHRRLKRGRPCQTHRDYCKASNPICF